MGYKLEKQASSNGWAQAQKPAFSGALKLMKRPPPTLFRLGACPKRLAKATYFNKSSGKGLDCIVRNIVRNA